mgnify:CR=1 FL=1
MNAYEIFRIYEMQNEMTDKEWQELKDAFFKLLENNEPNEAEMIFNRKFMEEK